MSRGRAEGVPMRAFHAEVVDVIDLAPAMRRVVFGGPGLARFCSTGVGDEYVRVLFPADPWGRPELPKIIGDDLDYGSIDWDRVRTYTVRAWDPVARQLTIDFVVHPGGVGAEWALRARPGMVVGVNSPRGLYDPPASISWQALVADYPGLPAAVRLAEQAPEGVRTHLVLEIPHESARVPIAERPGVEVRWVVGGTGHVASRLEGVMRSLPKPGPDGYVWVAGETRALRGVRAHLRRGLGLPAGQYKAVGYWTADSERWYEAYEALDPQVRSELERLWDSERPVEEIEAEYDARLTTLGL